MQNRRRLLAGIGAAAGAAALGPTVWVRPAWAAGIPLEAYDPFGPIDAGVEQLFEQVLLPKEGPKNTVARLWRAFEDSGNLRFAEWAVQYSFIWWRDAPDAERLRIAKVGQKLAATILDREPASKLGRLWRGAFLGFEALSRGVLDSLQVVPAMIETGEGLIEEQPGFYYGMSELMLARVYFKAPSFPVSKGDIQQSFVFLDKAEPHAAAAFGPYHLFLAEALHLSKQTAKRDKVMAEWEQTTEPVDLVSLFNYEMTRIDMELLKDALASGKYNRYLWDAFMIRIERDQMRRSLEHALSRFI